MSRYFGVEIADPKTVRMRVREDDRLHLPLEAMPMSGVVRVRLGTRTLGVVAEADGGGGERTVESDFLDYGKRPRANWWCARRASPAARFPGAGPGRNVEQER
jgi:hypothetical protein